MASAPVLHAVFIPIVIGRSQPSAIPKIHSFIAVSMEPQIAWWVLLGFDLWSQRR